MSDHSTRLYDGPATIKTQASVGDKINNYIFQVGRCTLSSKAINQETALMYLKRMWPGSKIEFVSEEFSHTVGDYNPAPVAKKSKVVAFPKATSGRPMDKLSIEERLEQSLIDSFGGRA